MSSLERLVIGSATSACTASCTFSLPANSFSYAILSDIPRSGGPFALDLKAGVVQTSCPFLIVSDAKLDLRVLIS